MLSLSDLHLLGSPGCGDLKVVSLGVLLTNTSPGAKPGGPVSPLGMTIDYRLDRLGSVLLRTQ